MCNIPLNCRLCIMKNESLYKIASAKESKNLISCNPINMLNIFIFSVS